MSKRNNSDHVYSPPAALKDAMAAYPSGTWVAISQDQRRIVGSGPTAARAEKQASAAGHQPTVLMQVSFDRSKVGRNGNGAAKGEQAPVPLNLPSFYRGIYKRVAKKLGCDPSYVSRVARGERTSESVSLALHAELDHALFLTNKNGTRLRRRES